MVSVMVFDHKLDLKGLRINDGDEVLSRKVLVACQLRHLPHNCLWKVLDLHLEWNITAFGQCTPAHGTDPAHVNLAANDHLLMLAQH
jgi:hypothetical protein